MASPGQQKMLWAVAKSNNLTTPKDGQTREMSTAKVNEVKEALEKGVDVFATMGNKTDGNPVRGYSRSDQDISLHDTLVRLADVLERLERRL